MSKLEGAIIPFDMTTENAKITELARLSVLDYEKRRKGEAKALDFRTSILDRLVNDARPKEPDDETTEPFEDIEPWPDAVDGAVLLSDLRAAIKRFCVLPKHSAEIMAAWVLHAWVHEAADISPILAFTSPEKRCGKTTALLVVGALVPKAMQNVNMSPSVLFRVIEKYSPTVLIDEADTFLFDNNEMRGIIDGGHNRLNAKVWRSVGDDHEPKQFKVWAPKCIAMIGKLPDTIQDRSLVVHLRRKQAGENVDRFRASKVSEFLPLRRRAQRWADDNLIRLRRMDLDVPEALNDRAQDNARAICAIADVAGGDWPQTIRAALVALAAQSDDEPQSAGVLLLRDISEIYERWKGDSIGSSKLVEELSSMEESPWAEWRRGNQISVQGVARLLKPYGVTSSRDRTSRFYRRDAFTEAFDRYIYDAPSERVTTVTTVTDAGDRHKNLNEINSSDGCDAGDSYFECDGIQESLAPNEGEF